MKTFYDILKINEDATDQEIINAYNKLEKKYKSNIEQLKNIQIAKEILMNPEARQNYDKKMYEMRQNELISKIKDNTQKYKIQKQNVTKLQVKSGNLKRQKNKTDEQTNLDSKKTIHELKNINEQFQKRKEKELKKQEKRDKRKQKRIIKKQEKTKQKLYEEAYSRYLESLGFTVKRRWTFQRIRKLFLSIVFIILICVILWNIPSVRLKLIELYTNNVVVKLFVDILSSIVRALYSGILGLRKVGG